jgi:hypothetical protein
MARLLVFIIFILFSCKKEEAIQPLPPTAYQGTLKISYGQTDVNVVVDKPALAETDVLILFHGTVLYDSLNIQAAENILERTKELTENKNIMFVSVAYPGENMLLGDNIKHAEAALLWVKNKASETLNIKIKKIFLLGHSQGGYLVTRLNTMHETNGVIANAPGPLNLVYRCQLEENGQIPSGSACTKIRQVYGTTTNNPVAYMDRSLLSFSNGFLSDILFVQGLKDTPIQMYSWPGFKKNVSECSDCKEVQILEIPGGEHASLFSDSDAKTTFNLFINSR